MLEVKTNKGNINYLHVDGSLQSIMADIGIIVVTIHKSIMESDPEQAKVFKNCMKKTFEDEACFADGLFADSIKKNDDMKSRINSLIKRLESDKIDEETIDNAIEAFVSALEG